MNRSMMIRAVKVTAGVTAAALVAVGCGGGSGGTGGNEAATSSGGRDYVPRDAILYATIDTDFEGDGWKKFDDNATKLNDDYEGIETEIEQSMSRESKVDYEDDVKSWLGETAGIAAVPIEGGSPDAGTAEGDPGAQGDTGFIAWVESTDDERAEEVLREQDGTDEAGEYEGRTLYADDDDYLTVDDGFVVIADTEDLMKQAIDTKEDGESIVDADGTEDAAEHVLDDAIFSLVVPKEGVDKMLEEQDDPQARGLRESDEFKGFEGMSVSFQPEDEGFRLATWAGFEEDIFEEGEQDSRELLRNMPASAAFAYGNDRLGPGLKRIADIAGDADPELAKQIAQGESVIGVTLDELSAAWEDEFALGVVVTEDSQTPTALLAIEETGDDTNEVTNELLGASQSVTGEAPTESQVDGLDVTEVRLGQQSAFSASKDEVTLVANDSALFGEYGGDDTLGDAEQFTSLADTAGVPDDVSALMWVDTQALREVEGLGTALANNPAIIGLLSRTGGGGTTATPPPPPEGQEGTGGDAEAAAGGAAGGDTGTTPGADTDTEAEGELSANTDAGTAPSPDPGEDTTTDPDAVLEEGTTEGGATAPQQPTGGPDIDWDALGPWIGWTTVDGGDVTFELFMQIEEGGESEDG